MFFLLLLLLCLSASLEVELEPESTGDDCQQLWRQDNLHGKCFGLKKISEYKEGGVDVPEASTIVTQEACKKLCCTLGDKCVTWQFMDLTKECKIGGPVRFFYI